MPSNRNELRFTQQAGTDMVVLCQHYTCDLATRPSKGRETAGASFDRQGVTGSGSVVQKKDPVRPTA